MKEALELIKDERKRQIEVKGYTPEHDQSYFSGELFIAAACYFSAKRSRALGNDACDVPSGWPFNPIHWKPSPNNRKRELEKAGALYMAHNESKGNDSVNDWVMMCAKELHQLIKL